MSRLLIATVQGIRAKSKRWLCRLVCGTIAEHPLMGPSYIHPPTELVARTFKKLCAAEGGAAGDEMDQGGSISWAAAFQPPLTGPDVQANAICHAPVLEGSLHTPCKQAKLIPRYHIMATCYFVGLEGPMPAAACWNFAYGCETLALGDMEVLPKY